MSYVYPELNGGLGNRMFIVAAAYVICRVNNLKLYLQNSTNKHSDSDYCRTVFRYFPAIFEEPKDRRNEMRFSQSTDYCYSPWSPEIKADRIYLFGYFQYYETLKKYECELRDIFLKGLAQHIDVLNSVYNFKNSCFIHVRRGDYAEFSTHPIQPLEYYIKAIEMITMSNPTIQYYVISDDIKWVKETELFKTMNVFEGNEIESLALMSLCDKAAICANSSFSWWGAFLGPYKNRNTVIIPNDYVRLPMSHNIFPKDWVLI